MSMDKSSRELCGERENINGIGVRQEVDGPPTRHLQGASCLCFETVGLCLLRTLLNNCNGRSRDRLIPA